MATSRDRSRAKFSLGSYTNGATYVDQSSSAIYFERNVDITGNRQGDNGWTKYTRDLTGVDAVTGTVPGSPTKHVDGWRYVTALGHNVLSHPVTLSWTDLAARTNVNRPDLNPLTLAQDFIELPRMLRDVGKYFKKGAGREFRRLGNAKETSNHYLALQFGWLPFVDDLKKLLETQSRVEKRLKRLNTLYNSGGEHRSVRVGKVNVEGIPFSSYTFLQPGMGQVLSNVRSFTSVDRWYSSRWKLIDPPKYIPATDALRRKAWDLANGLTLAGLAQGAWDVLPWSFMVDWFFDVGSWIAANANTVPVKMVSGCEMTHTVTEYFFERLPSSSIYYSGGSGEAIYDTKVRRVLTPGTSLAKLPVLDWWHVSILGSLAVQRFLR